MIGTYNWIGWQRALVSVLRARARNISKIEWGNQL